jgi:UDP-N-acetylmuramate--alanine ligase
MDAFGPALREADEIVLTDIYAASEEPIAGVTVDALADSIRRGSGRPVHVARQLDDVIPALVRIVRPGDAVLTLGAGSIGSLPSRLVEVLGKTDSQADLKVRVYDSQRSEPETRGSDHDAQRRDG